MSLSWLLGNRGASNGAGDDSDKSNSSSSFSAAEDSPDKKSQKVNFDASALERAATAAKYLEGSSNSACYGIQCPCLTNEVSMSIRLWLWDIYRTVKALNIGNFFTKRPICLTRISKNL